MTAVDETPKSKYQRTRTGLTMIERKAKEYVDFQVKAFRFALFVLGVNLTNAEVKSLNEGHIFSLSRFSFILVICAMLYFTIFLEDKEANKRLGREKISNHDNLLIDIQGQSFSFLLDKLVHEAPDINTKLTIIETVPKLFSLMPIEQVEKIMASGFQGIVETLSIFISDFDKKGNEIKQEINKSLEDIGLKRKVGPITRQAPPTIKKNDPLLPEEINKEIVKEQSTDIDNILND